jgi:hypothetical protein
MLGIEMIVDGKVEGNGKVSASRMAYYCRHDLVRQKVSK